MSDIRATHDAGVDVFFQSPHSVEIERLCELLADVILDILSREKSDSEQTEKGGKS